MTDKLAKKDGGQLMAFENFGEAYRAAEVLARSELVPSSFRGKAPDIVLAWQSGAELGLHPMQALRSIAVINGRAAIWGDAMVALVFQHPEFEELTVTDPEEAINQGFARCTIKRRGKTPVSRTFSMQQAKQANLAGKKGPWQEYPGRMLMNRARAWAIRDAFPDALSGIMPAEEALDMDPIVREAPARELKEPTPPPKKTKTKKPKAEKPGPGPEKPSAPEPSAAEALKGRAEAAKNLDELAAIGKEIGDALGAGELTDADRRDLEAVYKARKAALSASDPHDYGPPPMSEEDLALLDPEG